VTANSTTGAEYVTACDAARDVAWMRKFHVELKAIPSIGLPISLYYNENGAIAQEREPRSHHDSKHIEWHFYLI